MSKNFITNNNQHKTLKGRLNTLISISDELKFLVGFFYFSGWQELVESLSKNEEVKLKLLVGLQVDKLLHETLIEHGNQEDSLSQEEHFSRFIQSLDHAINNDEMDTEVFYNQVSFFIKMIQKGRLEIKKTANPNHAKLYLFHLNDDQSHKQGMKGELLTGSSNLTKAGLSGQEEFNVEIRDYGYGDADEYFEQLWRQGIPITEVEIRKKILLEFVRKKTQVANVTPFEAYALILKTFLDLQQQKKIKPHVKDLLKKIGFKEYKYQIDSVDQALSILEEYNGVIIADVVGLGKSVISSMIAKNIGERGLVVCPPGLMGNKNANTGWHGYLNDFGLYDWEVESRGKIEELAEHINQREFDVILVDEAHYFRNQDTAKYEALINICRGKKVILLTATPFNNTPADIFSLLKLFIIPGKSGITIEDNLEDKFNAYNNRYKRLAYIIKNYKSINPDKVAKAERYYTEYLGYELPLDIKKVKLESNHLSKKIKNVISPVVIRRNRLDLKVDKRYKEEIGDLSTVKDPEELFFYLSDKQADFYDRILKDYFGEEGRFTGAIYQPFIYEKAVDEEKLDEKGNRRFQQQRNLFDFMRRLLVKRFESSFGSFSESIKRFLRVHKLVRDFIEKTGGKYILDRNLIENIIDASEEEIDDILDDYENNLLNRKTPKNTTVYKVSKFEHGERFISDIEKDIKLFHQIQEEIETLELVQNDPKRDEILRKVKEIIHEDGEPKRKVILFSEYVDTVKHLETHFKQEIGERVLVCDGNITKSFAKTLNQNFDAQYKGNQKDQYDVLITSDKLAEGFNLNRAGAIINYDIPWNPTKVIQRVGRINRIGVKVFDELRIYNFFPTERGASHVKSKIIAQQKMFLIHNVLGEDSKIFDIDEEPQASEMYNRVNRNPDKEGEVSTMTMVRNRFKEIEELYPEVIEKINELPRRVKSAKVSDQYSLNVLRKKGLALFAQQIVDSEDRDSSKVQQILFEELLPLVECEFDEPGLDLSSQFWDKYEAIKNYKPIYKRPRNELAIENRAYNNLQAYLKLIDHSDSDTVDFIHTLITDIRKYHTLSKWSLRRLGGTELNHSSSKKTIKDFLNEVDWLKRNLGRDYLDRVLARVEHQKTEVIIAVENQYNL